MIGAACDVYQAVLNATCHLARLVTIPQDRIDHGEIIYRTKIKLYINYRICTLQKELEKGGVGV